MTDPWQFVDVADHAAMTAARSDPWLFDDLRSEARVWLPATVAAFPGKGKIERWVFTCSWRRCRQLVRQDLTRSGMPLDENGTRRYRPRIAASLTAPDWWDEDTAGEYMPGSIRPRPSTPSHEDEVVERAWWAYVHARVARLSERQRQALWNQIGDDPVLAAEWGVDRSRVSQIRRQAFEALADIEGEVA